MFLGRRYGQEMMGEGGRASLEYGPTPPCYYGDSGGRIDRGLWACSWVAFSDGRVSHPVPERCVGNFLERGGEGPVRLDCCSLYPLVPVRSLEVSGNCSSRDVRAYEDTFSWGDWSPDPLSQAVDFLYCDSCVLCRSVCCLPPSALGAQENSLESRESKG